MAEIVLTEQADADIDEILGYTLRRWGEAQYWEYFDLIQDAMSVLAKNPACRQPRSVARPGVLGHPIKQPGRNARHIMFYTVNGDVVTVLRILHDSMDFDRHFAVEGKR